MAICHRTNLALISRGIGQINFIPSPQCSISIDVSGDTHIKAILGHFAKWPYSNMAKMAQNGFDMGFPETAIQMQHSGEGMTLIGRFF